MNGIFNILKPSGMTSHDAVYRIRKKFNIQKVGHTGTLDQNVAGVLPITVGKATKLTQLLTNKDKTYRCIMNFGKKTTTSDTYGDIVDSSYKTHSYDEFKNACNRLTGDIVQIPSVYSAIKVDGQKLYEMARKGIKPDKIPPRNVKIYSINIIGFSGDSAIFDVSCSKGTYIRSLVEDIAGQLKDIAYMSLLIRTASGQFNIDDSLDIENISEKDLIPIEDINIEGTKDIVLDEKQLYRYVNGLKMSIQYIKGFEESKQNIYRIFNKKNNLISIANVKQEQLKNMIMLRKN